MHVGFRGPSSTEPVFRELVVDARPARTPSTRSSRAVARGVDRLLREFPSVRLVFAERASRPDARAVSLHEWDDPRADLSALDARIEGGEADGFVLAAADRAWCDAAEQLLTRYQWLVRRRNGASRVPLFDRILERHRALHDLGKPLVRADYVHSLDAWQWMLRLDPSAGLAAQVAALFHDVERLVTEADVRIEHRAGDYLAFKRAHARGGAEIVQRLLAELRAPGEVIARAAWLVEAHEESGADAELALLNDADALSFFSRNSDGFLAYYGEAHTRAKVRFTLGRLRPAAHARLEGIRLRPELRRFLEEETAGEPARAEGSTG